MIHLVFALFLAWLGLLVLLFIVLGLVILFRRLSAPEEAQELPDDVDAHSATDKAKPIN